MLPKNIAVEIERMEKNIKLRKERIDKLQRLAKLSKNMDLISEYDAIIKKCDDSINEILDSKEFLDAHKEQLVLRSAAKVRLMARGLKESLCNSEIQIQYLNNAIEDDNIKIHDLQDTKQNTKSSGGRIC